MDGFNVKFLDVNDIELSMQHFGIYDYIVFALMLIMCSTIGFYWGFIKKQNTQDYLIGGRNMKLLPISLSLIASYISGISLLGTPTEIYVYGTQYMFIMIGAILMAFIFSEVYLPVFHELRLTSTFEYLELRFDKRLRYFGSILFAIGLFTWLPIVIYVPALAFNQVSGVNIHIITPVVCIICIFYTCMGGLQAVVWTDVLQTIIMFGAIVLIAIKGTFDIGGISVVWSRNWESGRIEAPNLDPNPLVRHTVWGLIFGGCFNWLVSSGISQTMAQRYLALPTITSARKALFCFLVGALLIIFSCCYCGLLIHATYYDCDPLTTKLAKARDQLLPLLVMDVVGEFPGLPGIFIAGVFSAALSSLSTGLNSMAAVVLEDFYKPFVKNPLKENRVSNLLKIVVIVGGVLCVGLVYVVEKLGTTVLQLTMSLSGISNGAVLGMFTVGTLLPKVHSKGILVGGTVCVTIMSWICLGTQLSIANGHQKFAVKPVSVDGCQYSFIPISSPAFNNTDSHTENDEVFILYRLSYMWYTLLGTLITMIVSLIVSLVWDPIDANNIDPSMLAPFLRKYFTKSDKNRIQTQTSTNPKCSDTKL
ncbi:sodium-coupled monocarboxylate transporter 1-like [Arctopsyche grandis]|uniref:sodium-coupled monocarboxylate transporter 1-like n=1 Tax=Arctopsyche grandis TaxID=121162 RepID=UPI00406D6EF9